MLLFKSEHVEPILLGRKTQTRRLGKKRWNVGAVHQARTRMMDASSCFAYLEIGGYYYDALHAIQPYEAWAEGYESIEAYRVEWNRINGEGYWLLNPDVHVVCFRVARLP